MGDARPAFGDFGVIEVVDGTQVAGDAPNAADRRFFRRLHNDFFAVESQFHLPELFVFFFPESFLLRDKVLDFFRGQDRIRENVHTVDEHGSTSAIMIRFI